MCQSSTMPIDFEMLLPASPPIFNTTHSFLDYGYNTCHNNRNSRFNSAIHAYNSNMRSCLMEKSIQDHKDGGKKKVWFADDRGLSLTQVKVMSEPSNCPPNWTEDFLRHILKGVRPSPTSLVQWATQFAQPASDYMAFRDKLQRKCVSLENVIIRDSESLVSGTIKVKNLAFDKEVSLRVTFDKWASSEDVQTAFVPSGIQGGNSQYDTFSFVFSIPSSATKYEVIEFCVFFKCSGTEYWDNNDGKNYQLHMLNPKTSPYIHSSTKFEDTLKVNIPSWSEFASWNHLVTEGPYW